MRLLAVSKKPDAVVVGCLFFGLCLFYLSFQRGSTPTYDAGIYMDVARNLSEHFSLRVRNDPYGFNKPYASYGLGLSLTIVPLTVMQKALQPGGQEIVLLTNILFVAATAVLIYLLAKALEQSRLRAVTACLVFAMTTMAVQQSTDLFSEPGVAFFVLLTVFGLVKWRADSKVGPLLVGLGIGLAISFRSDSIVMSGVAILTVPAFVPWAKLRATRAKWMLRLALPIIVAMIYQLAYTQFRYGTLIKLGYPGQGFTTPFLTGFYGNTFSPGKGFFVYNCFLILGIPGLFIMWRRDRAFVAATAALVLVRPLFFARWWSWSGGVTWGPRFMFPLCPLLAIPAVATVRALVASASRFRVVALVGVFVLFATSTFIALLGVLVPFEQWYFVASGLSGVPQSPERSAARVHDYYWSFSGNHIAGNLRLLDEAKPFPLRWFSGGRLGLGVAALVVGLLLMAFAAVAAVRADRSTMTAGA